MSVLNTNCWKLQMQMHRHEYVPRVSEVFLFVYACCCFCIYFMFFPSISLPPMSKHCQLCNFVIFIQCVYCVAWISLFGCCSSNWCFIIAKENMIRSNGWIAYCFCWACHNEANYALIHFFFRFRRNYFDQDSIVTFERKKLKSIFSSFRSVKFSFCQTWEKRNRNLSCLNSD